MKSDANYVKVLGIIGAICVMLSIFMDVVRFDIGMNFDMGVVSVFGNLSDEEIDDGEETASIVFGFSMYDMRNWIKDCASGPIMTKQERIDNLEGLKEVYNFQYDAMFQNVGVDIFDESIENLFDLMEYAIKTYNLFLYVPIALVIVGVLMLVGTIASKSGIKILATLVSTASLVLMLVPAQANLKMLGIGVLWLLIGNVLCIISTIASFVSPGIYYYSEENN